MVQTDGPDIGIGQILNHLGIDVSILDEELLELLVHLLEFDIRLQDGNDGREGERHVR